MSSRSTTTWCPYRRKFIIWRRNPHEFSKIGKWQFGRFYRQRCRKTGQRIRWSASSRRCPTTEIDSNKIYQRCIARTASWGAGELCLSINWHRLIDWYMKITWSFNRLCLCYFYFSIFYFSSNRSIYWFSLFPAVQNKTQILRNSTIQRKQWPQWIFQFCGKKQHKFNEMCVSKLKQIKIKLVRKKNRFELFLDLLKVLIAVW